MSKINGVEIVEADRPSDDEPKERRPNPSYEASNLLEAFFKADWRARDALAARFFLDTRGALCFGAPDDNFGRPEAIIDPRGTNLASSELRALADQLNKVIAPYKARENVACVKAADEARAKLHALTGDVLATP